MKHQASSSDHHGPSGRKTTVEHAPGRALVFLRTVALDPQIAGAMRRVGFDEGELRRGWELLQAACGAPGGRARVARAARPVETPTQAAVRELDRFARTVMRRARAAVRREHPEVEGFLFGSAASARKQGIVVTVAVFLRRCDEVDRAVLRTLAKRGVTSDARREASAWVEAAQQMVPPLAATAKPSRAAHALDELHAWLRDWSACARTEITRRDWLIRLGIGRRHAR